ncbi:hypothetical protein Agabi119p4_7813 [Agaricus bisporus var. burnettii]|uniref:Uncharacterized protein n=1 Tax=Agaricus bisporus var. burnettii TaxID=192524 RepID=A0A8H7C8X6_AGABI|nr:hypothetical protein Agabi119p4_7813 [Agaricus bisporus var. burnettii]
MDPQPLRRICLAGFFDYGIGWEHSSIILVRGRFLLPSHSPHQNDHCSNLLTHPKPGWLHRNMPQDLSSSVCMLDRDPPCLRWAKERDSVN